MCTPHKVSKVSFREGNNCSSSDRHLEVSVETVELNRLLPRDAFRFGRSPEGVDLGPFFRGLDQYCVVGPHGRVLVKEVEGPQLKTGDAPGCCCIGDILRVRNVQHAHGHPGNHVFVVDVFVVHVLAEV